MKVIGQFNNVSEEVKKRIKPLGKGEFAHYRLLNGIFDIISNDTKYGSIEEIICRDTIYDEGKHTQVDIGIPRKIVDGEVKKVEAFIIAPVGENLLNKGVFTLHGGNLKHQAFYEFFELSNINKSNKFRDESVMARIERIDEVAEALAEEQDIDVLADAMILVKTMSAAEIRSFAAGKNWNLQEKPEIIRNRVKKYAKQYPKDFLDAQGDPEAVSKNTIKQALDLGIISFQPNENKIVWANGKTLAILDKPQDGESPVELFSEWLKASKNGENVLRSLANSVKNVNK